MGRTKAPKNPPKQESLNPIQLPENLDPIPLSPSFFSSFDLYNYHKATHGCPYMLHDEPPEGIHEEDNVFFPPPIISWEIMEENTDINGTASPHPHLGQDT
jgi:hypothetical protein